MGAGSWVREYAVQVETIVAADGLESLLATADSTSVTFGATKIGIGGDGTTAGKFKLLLQNKPDLVSSTGVKESEKASGTADQISEDIVETIAEPSRFAPEMHANSYIVSLFMQLMCQTGSSDVLVGSVMRDRFAPYSKIDVTYYGAFMGKVQKLNGVVDECQLMRGCLPSSVKLSAAEGDVLTLTADLMGAKWSNSFAGTGVPATAQGILKIAFLKWQNAKVYIDDAYATPADPTTNLKTSIDDATCKLNARGFEVTFSNNLKADFYNSENVMQFTLGKYKVEGSLDIPWVVPSLVNEAQVYYWKHISDFRAGIVKHIKIWWDNKDATTENSLVIDMYVKYKSGTLEAAESLENKMTFGCVQPKDGTSSCVVYCGHLNANLDRGLPAL